MLGRIIDSCARNKFMVFVLTAFGILAGWWCMTHAPLDAIPDLSDVQVIIFTEWPGRSPDLVEDQISYPIVTSLLNAPHVKYVRGQSFFGLSFVYVIFEDGTDMYWARSRVLEYMNQVSGQLPEGATPTIGPDATGVGWAYQYALVDRTGKHDLQQLRSYQDWTLRYELSAIPGVAEIASVGGYVKQYQVELDPMALLAFKVPISKIIQAIRESSNDVGGRVVEMSEVEYMVRGRGYLKSLEDLENTPVGVDDRGIPLLLKQVLSVRRSSPAAAADPSTSRQRSINFRRFGRDSGRMTRSTSALIPAGGELASVSSAAMHVSISSSSDLARPIFCAMQSDSDLFVTIMNSVFPAATSPESNASIQMLNVFHRSLERSPNGSASF